MADLPSGKSPGLGSLGGMAAKLMLKASLTMLLNTKSITDYLAAKAYNDETGLDFKRLAPSDKALWVNRVQSIIRAASDTVSL